MCFRKIILGVIAMSLLSGCSLMGNLSSDGESGNHSSDSGRSTGVIMNSSSYQNPFSEGRKLDKVVGISYDKVTKTLSWEKVDNADGYNVDANGSMMAAEVNSLYLVPEQDTLSVKIQAVNSGGVFTTSDWSDLFSCDIGPQDRITLAEVNTFVNGFKSSYKLKSITGMYITSADSKYYKGVLRVQGVFTVKGSDKTVDMERCYDDEIKSLSDAMTQKAQSTSIDAEYTLADYNSAQYLIDSNSYAGKMEEYRQQGWDFSVVSSCVGYKSNNSFRIFATYKLDKGNETKYIQSEIACGIENESTSEKINYTTKLLNASDRRIEELSFNECTEENGSLALAEQLDAARRGEVISFDFTSYSFSYGLYPQTAVDSNLAAALNGLEVPESNGWYLHAGEYYAKVAVEPSSLNDKSADTLPEYKWFRCKPIEWEYGGLIGASSFCFAKVVLDVRRYGECSEESGNHANNYKNSEIRGWLNGDFFGAAFGLHSALVKTGNVDNSASTTGYSDNPYACENTSDKVFLPSFEESKFGQNRSNVFDYKVELTDYSKMKGLKETSYWTRSPDPLDSNSVYVIEDFVDERPNEWGEFMHGVNRNRVSWVSGVRPALIIDLLSLLYS
jgi:hypothetical protein